MKYIGIIVLMMFTSFTFASTSCGNIRGNYTTEQIAAMKEACEQITPIQNAGITISSIQPEVITHWGQLSLELATALGVAAREIGVSVNEFVASPAGYITVGVILWKTIGVSLVICVMVLSIWMLGIWMIRHMWTNQWVDKEYTNIFGVKRIKRQREYHNWKSADDNMIGCCALVSIVIVAISVISVANL